MESMTHQMIAREEKISKIVDKVLKQVFGEEAARLIYRHLERNYSLKRSEIAEKIEVFAAGLEEFLRSGAYVIERKILEDIYSNYGLLRRLELERVQEESDFVSQVKSLMRKA
jgi:hypothetical protein